MPPLPRVPYFTDNPFRLLGVGSSTSLSALRQAARTAERALQVGLPTTVHLREVLGDEDLSACSNQLRALSTNPRLLALYRIFWPFEGPDARSEDLPYTDDDIDDFVWAQVMQQSFLRTWLTFLAQPDPDTLDNALTAYDDVDGCEYLSQHVRDLLLADGFTESNLDELVADAFREAFTFVYGFAARKAVDLWWSDAKEEAVELIHVLSFQGKTDVEVSTAFAELAPLGEELAREVQGLDIPTEWELARRPLPRPECVEHLRILVHRLKPYLSQAGQWERVWSSWVLSVGDAAHQVASSLAKSAEGYDQAETVLTGLLDWPISDTWREEIERDLTQIRARREARAQRRSAAAPQEKKPLSPAVKPPWLFTWSGIGTKLYGQTLCLVVFFIPVLPLARYVVHAEDGGYVFEGRRPFTLWHQAWVWAVIVLLFAVAVSLVPNPPRRPIVSLPHEAALASARLLAQEQAEPPPPATPQPETPPLAAASTESGVPEVPEVPVAAETEAAAPPPVEPPDVPFPSLPGPPVTEPEPVAASPEPESDPYTLALELRLVKMKNSILDGTLLIASQKRQLDQMDAEIKQAEAVVDARSTSLFFAKSRLERFESQRRRGLEVDDQAYKRSLDDCNAAVDRYNELLPGLRELTLKRSELFGRHNATVRTHNELVDKYNRLLLPDP